MATYISLVQFTDKGIHAAKETTQRIADWAAKVQSKGVTIKQMYWTLGHYDQVCVFEAPNDRRLPACCCPPTYWAISERRRYALLLAPRWKRFSPIFPDAASRNVFARAQGRSLLDSYDRGASRP